MSPSSILHPFNTVITVSELNNHAKTVLEQTIPLCWISGEISNLKCYPSGHWYFTLKDTDSQVRCVIFRHKNQYLDWQPKDGVQVEVHARATLYTPRGDFQLNVDTIRRAGLGQLFEAFERLKAKLEKAGLFAPELKKPIPTFPKQIGIITSTATAALQDVLSTLRQRMPILPIIIYPAPVQGEGAAEKIAESIHTAGKHAQCDVLILCRGGGSIEDLWAFNEEIVAQAIAACPIPIISGVGHETDYTIADFVADKRAPTPTGAAQLACMEAAALRHRCMTLAQRLQRTMHRDIEQHMQKMDLFSHRLLHPGERINNQQTHLKHLREQLKGGFARQTDHINWQLHTLQQRLKTTRPHTSAIIEQHYEWMQRLQRAMNHRMTQNEIGLQHQQTQLTHLNPQSVLERGYSISYTQQGDIIKSSNQLKSDETIKVKFAQGQCDAQITQIKK